MRKPVTGTGTDGRSPEKGSPAGRDEHRQMETSGFEAQGHIPRDEHAPAGRDQRIPNGGMLGAAVGAAGNQRDAEEGGGEIERPKRADNHRQTSRRERTADVQPNQQVHDSVPGRFPGRAGRRARDSSDRSLTVRVNGSCLCTSSRLSKDGSKTLIHLMLLICQQY